MASIPGNVPKTYYNIGGINTYVNPIEADGIMIHAVNVTSFPMGAKTKRTGYSAFLGTPDSAQVQDLFQFQNIGDNSGSMNLYRVSGSAIYYSLQGTGAWTLAGNGTVSNGAHFGQVVFGTTLIGGDAVGSTRHTTNGTSFTNTTLAPISDSFEEFQNRIYANGTPSTEFFSSTNDPTNWDTAGTSDSSSFRVPGAGKLIKNFKIPDTLVMAKSSGQMYKWDGDSLIDMATTYGPSSPYSVAKTEGGYNFFINQLGNYGFSGANPQLLSNAIQRQFYNSEQTGIAGTAFSSAPGVCHIYDYMVSVGTITDNFTSRTIPDAIIKYDYQKNEYLNYSYRHKPTSFLSYKDTNSVQQLIFGDATGQVYQLDNSTTDAGQPIEAEMVFFFTYGIPAFRKKWNYLRLYFNPGCEAKVQVAYTDTYEYETLRWEEIGDCSSGVVEYRFPNGGESKFLFMRIYESSTNSRFTYFGCDMSADVITIS